MSFIPESWTGVDELRDKVWLLEKKIESLEMMYAHGQQPWPTPQRALDAAAVLADAIVKHEPSVSPLVAKRPAHKTTAVRPRAGDPATFYEQMGGYTVVSRYTEFETFVRIHNEAHRAYKQKLQWRFQFFTGYGRHCKRKSKMFATRLAAELFAFDVLKIHEAECIARKKPTDWWNRVKIFEEIKP